MQVAALKPKRPILDMHWIDPIAGVCTEADLQDQEPEQWCEVQLAEQGRENTTIDLKVGFSDLQHGSSSSSSNKQCIRIIN